MIGIPARWWWWVSHWCEWGLQRSTVQVWETKIDVPLRHCLPRNVSVGSKCSVSRGLVDVVIEDEVQAGKGHTSRNEFQVSSCAISGEERTWRAPRPAVMPSELPAAGLLLLFGGVPDDCAGSPTCKYSAMGVSASWSLVVSVV